MFDICCPADQNSLKAWTLNSSFGIDKQLKYKISANELPFQSNLCTSEQALNAMVKKRKRSEEQEELPEGCNHYQDISEVPWDIQKYHNTLSTSKTCAKTAAATGTSAIRFSRNTMMAYG